MKGVFTAMITPFDEEGNLEREGLKANLNDQLEGDVDGVVVLGTTGEAATLTPEEQEAVIGDAVEVVGDRLQVIVGAGSNSTKEAIEKVRRAKKMGAHAALTVSPYYNKPTQKGLYQHFEAIAQAVDLPLLLYNTPSRTGVNIEPLTVRALAKLPNIVGIKESAGDMEQMSELLEHRASGFSVLTGDDPLTLATLALGGDGVVSVLSNLAPSQVVKLVQAMERGELEEARRLHFQLFPVCRGLFFETNPIPIKEAMRFCGKAAGQPRLPLHPMSEPHNAALHQLLIDAGLAPQGAFL